MRRTSIIGAASGPQLLRVRSVRARATNSRVNAASGRAIVLRL
jgi:hypothetical protein